MKPPYRTSSSLLAGWLALMAPSDAGGAPLEPSNAIRSFELAPGIAIELVAAEPLVASPVAMTWDNEGRLFVVENRGYPTGMPNGSPGGQVVRLQDSDGDGTMDQRQVFADGFSFPNGITAWDGGFFVTCAPDIWFLKDTNGDGEADVRKVVLTGFDTSRSTQLRVAQPLLGPDGWIHLTSGLAAAANIVSPAFPERPPAPINGDLRFHPKTFRVDAVAGRGQFGQSFDDWGARFHNMNRVHIQHAVFPEPLRGRNPHYRETIGTVNVPEGLVNDLLRADNRAARLYPISDNLTTADSHAGTFSAACALHVYRSDGLPADCYGDIFTCDPTANLVHRDRLEPTGPTFCSHMVDEGREFLASTDNWFRPVFLATGPDGALYVADMYRGTIEHPDYLPQAIRDRTDFEQGRDRGRIWRLRDATPPESTSVPPKEFLSALEAPQQWRRERALRMALTSTPESHLDRLLDDLRSPSLPNGPMQSDWRRRDPDGSTLAWKLHAAVALTTREDRALMADDPVVDVLLEATTAPSVGARLAAWRHLASLEGPTPRLDPERVEAWGREPNPAVRFWSLLTLGGWDGPMVARAWRTLAQESQIDPWASQAFLTGALGQEAEIIDQILLDTSTEPDPTFARALGRYVGSLSHFGRDQRVALIQRLIPKDAPVDSWHLTTLTGLADGVGLGSLARAERGPLTELGLDPNQVERVLIGLMREWDGPATLEPIAPLLALTGTQGMRALALSLESTQPATLQESLIAPLLAMGTPEALQALTQVDSWTSLQAPRRATVLEAFLRRKDLASILASKITDNHIPIGALSRSQRQRLKDHLGKDHPLFHALDSGAADSDRMAVFERLRPVATESGNASRGQQLFVQQCSTCHRLDGVGAPVGPDLYGMRNQDKETVLLHLLVPNLEEYPQFATTKLTTNTGEVYTGLRRDSTSETLALIQPGGATARFPRDQVASVQSSVESLMPDGFEATMSREELADLLAYLRGE